MRSPTLLLALAAVFAHPVSAPAEAIDGARTRSPEVFETLLARYDAMSPGAARDQLALAIDKVAAQRYATVSRLFWYTDLDEARRVARAKQRPILALRMLGRLDEDLSCANSRLFRATLYANTEVSRLLRDHFVLYWSSERAVPRVTIDFGDGRKLERTTTGNSAHYVLDEEGRVLDALPGLYAPSVFRAELARSAQLAKRVRPLADQARDAALIAHHQAESRREMGQFDKVAGTPFLRGRLRLLGRSEVGTPAVQRAQRSTMSKMAVEVPDLGKIGIDAGAVPTDDIATWAVVGQQVWRITNDAVRDTAPRPSQELAAPAIAPKLLDGPSLALVRRLHDAGPVASSPAAFVAMLDRLEQTILADTALNQFRLRGQIRAQLASQPARSLGELNRWIYANVFHTPATDPWIGLLPRTDFTGLPGDGVVMR